LSELGFGHHPVEISTDIGRTWVSTADTLLAIETTTNAAGTSLDGHRFWLLKGNYLFSTSDNGTSWDSLWYGQGLGVSWCDALHGLLRIHSDSIVVTGNGGKTWETVVTQDSSVSQVLNVNNLRYLAPGVIEATDYISFWISTDTGKTWTFTRSSASNIVVVRDDLWYRPGFGQIYRTTNRGISWDSSSYSCPNGPGYIVFSGPLHGIMWDGLTICAQTNDGGQSWDCFDTTLYSGIRWSANDGTTYYGEVYLSSLDYLSKTSDRGSVWHPLFPYPEEALSNNAPLVVFGHRFYFAYFDRLEWTNEVGHDWQRFGLTSYAKPFVKLAPDGSLWTGNILQLAISSDSGSTWSDVTANLPNYTIDSSYSFTPVSRLTGFAKTLGGVVYRTTDGGVSWRRDSIIPDIIIDSRHWLIGPIQHGGMAAYLRISNSGLTWDTVDTWLKGQPSYSTKLFTVDSNRWFFGGYYTKDAGKLWLPIPGWDNALNLTVMDSSTAFGYNNAAILWRLDLPYYSKPLKSVSTITSTPATFSLSVNPNPADGQTELRFTLGAEAYVRVQVCDILGRTVAGDEAGKILSLGDHRLPLDLSSNPAGTYYLRLFTDTGESKTIKLVKE
jgi:photosystem II stability/assembly factor-like uncharacterized protein